MKKFVTVRAGNEYFNENNGFYYRILDGHFGDFYAEYSEEWDEEKEEFVNFKKCYLTKYEVGKLAGGHIAIFESEEEEEAEE